MLDNLALGVVCDVLGDIAARDNENLRNAVIREGNSNYPTTAAASGSHDDDFHADCGACVFELMDERGASRAKKCEDGRGRREVAGVLPLWSQ